MLLERLTQCTGVSGREAAVAAVIEEEVKRFADEVYRDALGNLIAHKKGNGKRIMLAAHMDEIGVAVTYIDDNGFLRFSAIGGLYIKRLLNRRVVFENGVVGVIDTESDNRDLKLSKMYIDIGASGKKEASELVAVGDMAAFEGGYVQNGDIVMSKALDNRAGCYALVRALQRVSGENDLYFCFTAQEEVGLDVYKRQLSLGSIIIEIGTNGNTLDEAKKGGELIGDVLVKVLSENKG